MSAPWYLCSGEDFDRLMSTMGYPIFVDKMAEFMGYDSGRQWANGRAYAGTDVRGSMRRGKYHQPCNATSGEITCR